MKIIIKINIITKNKIQNNFFQKNLLKIRNNMKKNKNQINHL